LNLQRVSTRYPELFVPFARNATLSSRTDRLSAAECDPGRDDLHMGGYSNNSPTEFQKRMLQEAAGIPRVRAVGIISETPLGTGGSSTQVYRLGTTDFRSSNSAFGAKYFSISPRYLQAAGTHLLTGRDFTWHDDADAPKVAIVNDRFARAMFGDTSVLGLRFMMADKVSTRLSVLLRMESMIRSPNHLGRRCFSPLRKIPTVIRHW
jgi:hypothetical protein